MRAAAAEGVGLGGDSFGVGGVCDVVCVCLCAFVVVLVVVVSLAARHAITGHEEESWGVLC